MIIGVDARNIYRPRRRGIGKTLVDLYRHLAAVRPLWQFVLFHQQAIEDDPLEGLPNVRRCRFDIPGDRWNLWQQFGLPLAARKARVELLHCPANTAPRWPGAPLLVTIHDLIPLEFANPSRQDCRWGKNVAAAARRARVITCPSRYTAQQVHRTFGIPADKIIINPWAPDTACQPMQDERRDAQVRQRYGIPPARPFVLALGGADPRKNSAGILRAWSLLPPAVRQSHMLLLIGIEGDALARLAGLARNLKIADGCRLQGFANEADVPALISAATVLCYPSLSEGFGLPILDGFACRTAVLTGNTTSLPEVAGDAAWLVNAAQPPEIAAGLNELLTNSDVREDLIRRGCRRIESFTWQACAARAAQAMERAVNSFDPSELGEVVPAVSEE
jgi:glycosyltransferase involved in cell wall biosynthesis